MNRASWAAVAVVCGLVLSCLSLLSPAAGPVVGGADVASAATSTNNCGGARPRKPNGTYWSCTFSDEFSGKVLDSTKWAPMTTAQTAVQTADTCYVNTARNIFFSNGALVLSARTETAPVQCTTKVGIVQTSHTGGAVMSWNRCSQAYGRYEFRARFPNTDEAGFHGNAWLYPQALNYGAWPASGEIDVAEHWTGHGDSVYPSLHYSGSTNADTQTACTVRGAQNYHLYRLEWSPSSMRFYYDDRLCFDRSWTPTGVSAPAPFDKPFFLILSQGHGDVYYAMSKVLPARGDMAIDWVRVYK